MDELIKAAESLIKAAESLKECANRQTENSETKSQFLTMEQAAAFLGISKNSLYRLTSKKEITYFKPNGKQIYFLSADLTEWQSRNRQPNRHEIESEIAKNLI